MKRPVIADVTFALFLLSWVITRHVLFAVLLYSVIMESRVYLPLELRPRDGYFFNVEIYLVFVGLLSALQVLICLWFRLIVKVAWNVVVGKGVDDTRSEAYIVSLSFGSRWAGLRADHSFTFTLQGR